MSARTSIAWCDRTWNPIRGCSRVSAGCDHCYAMGQAHRFSGPGQPYEGLTRIRKRDGKVDWSGVVRLVPSALDEPLRIRRPQRWFVNSMSDLFHESLSDRDIATVFAVMSLARRRHTFQILTKRPQRMARWFAEIGRSADAVMRGALEISTRGWTTPAILAAADQAAEDNGLIPWPLPNVWLGVSVENQETADERIPDLLEVPAAIRFVSYEPAIGPVWFNDSILGCSGHLAETFGNPLINWVIVGGESGPGSRPFDLDWARQTIRACKRAGVPVFVKQLGSRPGLWVEDSTPLVLSYADRKGEDIAEWPEDLRVREFPEVRR